MCSKKTIHYDKDIDKLIDVTDRQGKMISGPIILAAEHQMDLENVKIKYKGSLLTAKVLTELFFRIRTSTSTIIELGKLDSYASIDCLPIARGVVESCINATYIMAAGDEVARRAISHSIAKTFYDSDKRSGNGLHAMRVTREFPPEFKEQFQDLIDEFTSKKGRQLNWTNLSVGERIDEIAKVFDHGIARNLNAAYIINYSRASEIIHGSYLGCLIAHRREPFTHMPLSSEGYKDRLNYHFEGALLAVFMSTNSAMKAFTKHAEIDDDPFGFEDYFNQFSEIVTADIIVYPE